MASQSLTIKLADTTRRCGECQLCCKLLPTREINKPAGERCQHQKHGVGCKIYPRRPSSCAMWSCRWLTMDDTADLRRPDRSRYVLDLIPDHVTLRRNEDGAAMTIEVVQIWCDPHAPDAWRDPALLAYLERRGKDGIAALIRFDNKRGIGVFPPTMASDGRWHEYPQGELMPEHSLADTLEALKHAGEWTRP